MTIKRALVLAVSAMFLMLLTQCVRHGGPAEVILLTATETTYIPPHIVTPADTFTPTSTGTIPATGTPTPTPTLSGGIPDLVVNSIFWQTMWPVPSCITAPYPPLGVFVNVGNSGTAQAVNFKVSIDGAGSTIVASLAPGANADVWVPCGAYYGLTARVDTDNTVAESDESNNSLDGYVAAATPPPTCATPAATFTFTQTMPATPTYTPTGTATVIAILTSTPTNTGITISGYYYHSIYPACSCTLNLTNPTVILQPLGLHPDFVDPLSGTAVYTFSDVPPGDYTVQAIGDSCTITVSTPGTYWVSKSFCDKDIMCP